MNNKNIRILGDLRLKSKFKLVLFSSVDARRVSRQTTELCDHRLLLI